MRGYLKGATLGAVVRGHRRIVAAIKARTTEPEPEPCEHPEHKKKPEHAEHCASHPAAKAEQGDVKRPVVTWAWRAGGTAGVLWLLWPLVGAWLPTTVTVSVLLWVLAALVAGQGPTPEAAPEKAAAAGTATSTDDGEWIDEAPEPPVLYALIRHVAAASDQGTAAHLQQVLEEGQQRGLFGDWTVSDLRGHLAGDLGLPVEELKLHFRRRQRVRLGVRLKALPEADPAPVPAVLQEAV